MVGFALAIAMVPVPEARADVVARIDLSSQRMHVSVNGAPRYSWKISTARRGYRTPRGRYRPQWLSRHHRSRRYNNAPMPYSIFFYKGYAIHGTDQIRHLGRPASHGCVRLHPSNAAKLYGLVQRHGKRKTQIVVTN